MQRIPLFVKPDMVGCSAGTAGILPAHEAGRMPAVPGRQSLNRPLAQHW